MGKGVSERWHIVATEPAREKAVLERLRERELKPYLPVLHREVRAGRLRKRPVALPMFPCYLFVPLSSDPDAGRLVRSVRGVHDFLMVDHKRPALLSDEAIEAIRLTEGINDTKWLHGLAKCGALPYKVGEQVWVKHLMPFRALLATVASFDARGRVEVLLEMELLGRKHWAIEPHLIESAGL